MSTLIEQITQSHLELAQKKHTPTQGMQTSAKRGLRLTQQHNDMDPVAVAVGKRIASGRHLTNDHVEHMASYHAAHDGPCPTDTDADSCEDMLWGGAAGAHWSAARVAALDVTSLAEHDCPTILQLDQEGKGVSLEVFVRDGMGEAVQLDEEKGLIWAPILRSGMLATRPGPNGEKKHEPLVFVSGHASDPRKEIGLQNLVDSFKAGAIQHVTIPTNHDNGVLDNTGFIKDVKIIESKKRPGEKVLVAAHDFRDPDVRRKVELGTIANRSCGIVYDYVDTESGHSYDQVIDHVALTNRPWVKGMTPYGEADEEEFARREIIPMLLSEVHTLSDSVTDDTWDDSPQRFEDSQWTKSCVLDLGADYKSAKERCSLPIREPDGTLNAQAVQNAAGQIAKVKGANLSQKKAAARKLISAYRTIGDVLPEDLRELVGTSTSLSERDRNALLLADVQWGAGELSLNDMVSQVVGYLDEMRSPEEFYPNFSVLDVVGNPDPKALVLCDYGDPDGANDSWVIPLEVDGDKVHLSDFSNWTPVQKQWVTDDDAAEDKREVAELLPTGMPLPGEFSADLRLASLTTKARNDLPNTDFVFPDTREYPIHDVAHGRNALARGSQDETGKRLATIRRKVYARYPQLKSSPSNMAVSAVSAVNSANPLKGGAIVPPTMNEVMERLGLSEEQRAALAPVLDENSRLKTRLSEVTKTTREQSVKARVKQLQDAKFPPGFCRRYEEIALGDDGDVAAVLNLSDDSGNRAGDKEFTATQIAESLIKALPIDKSGALALADQADLLTSPISGRPPLDPEDQKKVEEKEDPNRAQTGDEWLSEVAGVDPGLAEEIQRSFKFSTQKGA